MSGPSFLRNPGALHSTTHTQLERTEAGQWGLEDDMDDIPRSRLHHPQSLGAVSSSSRQDKMNELPWPKFAVLDRFYHLFPRSTMH